MLHVPLHADLMNRFTHSCLWMSQRSLANVTNLRSLICERSVGSLSPFTVGLCRITSHEVFSLKTFSFTVIYYSLISNVYATHCLSEDQFFRAGTTKGCSASMRLHFGASEKHYKPLAGILVRSY